MALPRFAISCAVWSVVVVAASAQAESEAPPRPFLRKVIQLSDAQLAAIERGDVVTKQLQTSEKAEIAAFGIVKVKGTQSFFLQKVRDIQSFRKVPQIPQMGTFGTPPSIGDLAGLSWEASDIDALRRCKPGACDVKIGMAGLERLQKEVNWSAPDARTRTETIAKEQMLAFVKAYAAGGTDSMGMIVDKQQPKALSAEFRSLLRNSPYLPEYVPEFNQYLESYPKGSLANASDVLYWTKDTFGLKPVVSMTHATIWMPEGPTPRSLVALKTLYASHYFNAALEVMVAVDLPDRSGFYLLDLYRTRIDPPTGMLAGVLMGKVKSGVEQGVSENLKTAKSRVEGP